jgi:hypothetical protein
VGPEWTGTEEEVAGVGDGSIVGSVDLSPIGWSGSTSTLAARRAEEGHV